MMRVLLAVLALLAGTAWFVTAAEGAQRTAGSCDAGDFAIAGCSYDSSSAATTPPVNPHSDAARARPDSSSVPRASTSRITPSLATKAETRLLGPGTSFGTHVEDQLATRGWTKRLVQSTVDDPASTVATRDIRNLRGGGRMDDPATGYISRRGGYVVRNDRTGDIVQVSNRTKPGWKAPWDR